MKSFCLPVLAFLLGSASLTQAQTYTESTLYNFPQSAIRYGVVPGSLVRDATGNLYGTTAQGGPGNLNCNGGSGCGTIFKLSTKGVLTTLCDFTGGSDGINPCCLVIDKSGNLYGTTALGGL